MVGPLDLDELERLGVISFAACLVMSPQKWQQDQQRLRWESYKKRQANEERLFGSRQQSHCGQGQIPGRAQQQNRERQHREQLKLPASGALKATEIKSAYRKLAQKLHPDAGGSQERFVQITQARDALLAAAV